MHPNDVFEEPTTCCSVSARGLFVSYSKEHGSRRVVTLTDAGWEPLP